MNRYIPFPKLGFYLPKVKAKETVNEEDLKRPDFSTASDLSKVIENALHMKYVPLQGSSMIQ